MYNICKGASASSLIFRALKSMDTIFTHRKNLRVPKFGKAATGWQDFGLPNLITCFPHDNTTGENYNSLSVKGSNGTGSIASGIGTFTCSIGGTFLRGSLKPACRDFECGA